MVAALALILLPALSVPAAAAALSAPTPASTFASAFKDQACQGLTDLDSSTGCNATADNGIHNLVTSIVKLLSTIVGILAVIFIIVGGFKYVTSGGDSNRVSSAKNTIIYALVGLVIVAISQFLVNFVFNTATKCQYNSKLSATSASCVAPKKT